MTLTPPTPSVSHLLQNISPVWVIFWQFSLFDLPGLLILSPTESASCRNFHLLFENSCSISVKSINNLNFKISSAWVISFPFMNKQLTILCMWRFFSAVHSISLKNEAYLTTASLDKYSCCLEIDKMKPLKVTYTIQRGESKLKPWKKEYLHPSTEYIFLLIFWKTAIQNNLPWISKGFPVILQRTSPISFAGLNK